jgi:hypothetical protein
VKPPPRPARTRSGAAPRTDTSTDAPRPKPLPVSATGVPGGPEAGSINSPPAACAAVAGTSARTPAARVVTIALVTLAFANRLPHFLVLVLLSALLTAGPAAAVSPRVKLSPADGPAGTRAALAGTGFGRGSTVTVSVRGGRRLVAVAGRGGYFRATVAIPRGARGRTPIESRTVGIRVRNSFRAGRATGLSELVTAAGPRVRWRVAAGTLHLAGGGFGPRRIVSVRGAGSFVSFRTDRRGRFALQSAVRSGRAVVRSGRTRIVFRFREPDTGGGSSGQPQLPIRAAFYYPWFPEAWRQRGIEPFTRYTPSSGFYSSTDAGLLRRHVDELRYAKVQAGIVSWWGQGTRSDSRVPALLDAARGTPFRWALYYEEEARGDPDPAAIRADLIHIRDRFAADPSYLRVDGRFVVFVYSTGSDGSAMAERWRQANDVGAYVVLKVFPGYRDAPSQPDGWHQYAPAHAEDDQAGQSFGVSPGFWHVAEQQPRLDRDVARFAASVRAMVASGAPWQLVATFNEWGEGTAVEPAAEWQTPSGFGAYLDVLHSDGR